MPGLSEPGFSELLIVGMTFFTCLAIVASRLARLRYRPPEESSSPSDSPRGIPWHQLSLLLLGLFLGMAGLEDLLRLAGIGGGLPGTVAVVCLLGCLVTTVTALIVRRRLARTGRRLPHIPWLRRINFSVAALVMLTMFATLLIPAARRPQEGVRNFSNDPLPTERWQTLRVPSGNAAIRVPPGWKPEKLEGASNPWFTAGSVADDLWVSIGHVPRADLVADDLTGFTAHVIDRLGPTAEVSSQLPVIVDGKPGRELLYEITAEGVHLRCQSLLLETPEVFWIVNVWSSRSRFAAHQETLRRVCHSFTVD